MAPITLSHLHEDAWLTVLQFLTLDDLLITEKLFGISSAVFSTMIGCEIQSYKCSDPINHGGLFYRVLNEKLISKQLENCITRINRNFQIYALDDYDEETHSHNPKRVRQRGRVRMEFFTRSRLNVEPCGRSMCKLRSELKRLTEICNAQFPHIYQEKKLQIENSMRRSTRVCTPFNMSQLSDEDRQLGWVYVDNSQKKPNKPSIWNQSRREESIIVDLKKPKVKYFKWRTQWSHMYRNYLLLELEYYVSYMNAIFNSFQTPRIAMNWDPVMYTRALDSVYETLSKFNEQFQITFLTERDFHVKKSKKRSGYKIHVPEIDRSQFKNLDFITHSTHGLVKLYRYFVSNCIDQDETLKELLKKQIDRNMTLYAKYFEHDLLREINLRKTIYHYLFMPAEHDLVEKHFTQKVMDLVRESSEPIQTTMVLSFIQAAIPNFEFLKTLKFSLSIASVKYRSPISLIDSLIFHDGSYQKEEYPLAEWLNFFINNCGKEQVIDKLKDSPYLASFIKEGKRNHVNSVRQLLGSDLFDKVINEQAWE